MGQDLIGLNVYQTTTTTRAPLAVLITEPPTLVLPKNPAPWVLPNSLEKRHHKVCKSPLCLSFPFSGDTKSKVMPIGKKTQENQDCQAAQIHAGGVGWVSGCKIRFESYIIRI